MDARRGPCDELRYLPIFVIDRVPALPLVRRVAQRRASPSCQKPPGVRGRPSPAHARMPPALWIGSIMVRSRVTSRTRCVFVV